MFPAFVLLVSKVVLIFDPLGGKPQVVLIFGAILSLGPVLIFGAGVYLNVLVHALPHYAPPPPSPVVHSSHAFIDDPLLRSTCPHHIQTIINFFDTVGRRWGLDLNLDKPEVQAM